MLETEDRVEEQIGSGTNPDNYWALEPAEKLVQECKKRRKSYLEYLRESGILNRIKTSYAFYHGLFYNGSGSIGDCRISCGGEDGEWDLVSINQFRSVLSLLKTYVASSDIAWDAIAKKSSYSTVEATKRANEFLDCLSSSPESGLQAMRKNAIEEAIVLAFGYGWVFYDESLGPETDADETTIYHEGDFRFLSPSFLDVAYSTDCPFNDSPWVTVRRRENKFDLIAQHPDLKDEILKGSGSSTQGLDDIFDMGPDTSLTKKSSDTIWVYYFYHRETPSIPKGRHVRFVTEKAVLKDGPLEGCVPVHQLLPSKWLLSTFGYSMAWDLVGAQEALHLAVNTIVTNQDLFGGGHIQFPSGQPVRIGEIEGIGTVFQSDGDIKPLQFLSNPQELFKAVDLWGATMEKVSAVNSAARGQPSPQLHAARAIEFTEQRTQQSVSDLAGNIRQFTAEIGTSTVKLLAYHGGERDYTTKAASGQKETKSITPEILASLDKVAIVEGNPALQTIEGRVKFAETLIQMGIVKDVTKIVNVMEAGDLEPLTDLGEGQEGTIKAENELLLQKIAPPPPYKYDNHQAHIRGHLAAISNPKTRGEIELAFVGAHMEQHLEFMRNPEVMAHCAVLYPDYPPLPAFPPPMGMGMPMPGAGGPPMSPGGPPVPPGEPKATEMPEGPKGGVAPGITPAAKAAA